MMSQNTVCTCKGLSKSREKKMVPFLTINVNNSYRRNQDNDNLTIRENIQVFSKVKRVVMEKLRCT